MPVRMALVRGIPQFISPGRQVQGILLPAVLQGASCMERTAEIRPPDRIAVTVQQLRTVKKHLGHFLDIILHLYKDI